MLLPLQHKLDIFREDAEKKCLMFGRQKNKEEICKIYKLSEIKRKS
jgi:hypothetical protein